MAAAVRPAAATGSATRAAADAAAQRTAARAALGITGDDDLPAWRDAVPDTGRRRVTALAAINASLLLPLTTLLVLLPVFAPERGWGTTVTGWTIAVGAALAGTLALPLSDRTSAVRRARPALFIAFNAAVLGLFVNLLPVLAVFALLVLARGVVVSLGASVWRPFAFESVVPEARGRALARTTAGAGIGVALGAIIGWLGIAGPSIGTGQALTLSGALGLLVAIVAVRLTDTPEEGFAGPRLSRVLGRPLTPRADRPSWRDAYTEISAIRSLRICATSYVAAGWALGISLIVPVTRLAESRDLTAGTTPLVVAITGTVAAITILVLGPRIDATRRQSPEALARIVPVGILLGFVGLFALGVVGPVLSPQLSLAVIGGMLAWIALDLIAFSVVRPELRPALAGMTTFSLVGGSLTALLTVTLVSGLLDGAAAYPVAFVAAALPLLLFWKRAKRLERIVGEDLDTALGVDTATVEFEETVGATGMLPALSARNVNFSYGSVQVLFDVSLRVEEGEMVALLGPNGVGKTTLLRVLSGLERPQAGSIRLAGADVTDIPASKRVVMGISQIVGGSAVFGSMTVYENLQMYGFSMGRDRATIDQGIDAAFQVFPRLADRRNQLGSTLSGGEQQMLGLSKALITRPRILVVDEFSLGLAPIIVGELLGMVRALNQAGTAILIVEQSVNVALNLVNRCYFMEKGRIVYEGRSADLLAQPDLVQALSLGGVPHETAGGVTV